VRLVVCDVGLGNLRSVERALRTASSASGAAPVEVEVTSDPRAVEKADRLVMPGQGGFGDCARALSGPLGDAVREHVRRERPYLGICLGLQVLFASSEEAPGCAGLAIFEGHVERVRGGLDATTQAPLKVPHVGWNEVAPADGHAGLLAAGRQHFYFVHGYVVVPRDRTLVAGTTEYGEAFVSAIARGNLFACQFHPEKSQQAGLALLARFLAS
jgi:imidazole glycerol-phosphate synthase subunit HisH